MTPCLRKKEGPSQTTRARQVKVMGKVADDVIDDLAHVNHLDLTWGYFLDAFLRERAQHEPAVGEAGGGTLETIGLSQGGVVDVSSPSAGRAETETIVLAQGGAVDPPLGPSREYRYRPQRSINSRHRPKGRLDTSAVVSGRTAHELSNGTALRDSVRGRPGVRASAWGMNLVSIG